MIGFDIGARFMPNDGIGTRLAGVDAGLSPTENDRLHGSLNEMPAAVTNIIENVTDLVNAFSNAANFADRVRGGDRHDPGREIQNDVPTIMQGDALLDGGRDFHSISSNGTNSGDESLSRYGQSQTNAFFNNRASPSKAYDEVFQAGMFGVGSVAFDKQRPPSSGAITDATSQLPNSHAPESNTFIRPVTSFGRSLDRHQDVNMRSSDTAVDQGLVDALMFAKPAWDQYAVPNEERSNVGGERSSSTSDATVDLRQRSNQQSHGKSDDDQFMLLDDWYAKLSSDSNSKSESDGISRIMTLAGELLTRRDGLAGRGTMLEDESIFNETKSRVNRRELSSHVPFKDLGDELLAPLDYDSAYSYGNGEKPTKQKSKNDAPDYASLNATIDAAHSHFENSSSMQSSDAIRVTDAEDALSTREAAVAWGGASMPMGTQNAFGSTQGLLGLSEKFGWLSSHPALVSDQMFTGQGIGIKNLWENVRDAERASPKVSSTILDPNIGADLIGDTAMGPLRSLGQLLTRGTDMDGDISQERTEKTSLSASRQGPTGHKNDPIYIVAISPATGTHMPTVPTPGTSSRTPPIPGQRNLP